MLELEQNSHILLIEDPNFRKTVTLNQASYKVGRDSNNDIIFSSQRTSRYHATFVRRTDIQTNKISYWIIDGDLKGNRSRNGIFVNGKKCLVHSLKHGDLIKFSNDVTARYNIVSSDYASQKQQQKTIFTSESQSYNHNNHNNNTIINKETIVNSEEQFEQLNDAELSRLSSISELSPHPIIESDLQGNITYINSAAIVAFKDITRKRLNHPLLSDLVENCDKNNNSFVREVVIGNSIFQQNSHYLSENKIIRSYIKDITYQTKIEKIISEKTSFYKSLLNNLTDNILLVNVRTNEIVFINQSCLDLLGYSENNIYKTNIYDLSDNPRQFKKILEDVIEHHDSISLTHSLKHCHKFSLRLHFDINYIKSEIEELYHIVLKSHENLEFSDRYNYNFTSIHERQMYEQQLNTALANARRDKTLLSVVFIEIFNFDNLKKDLKENIISLLLSSLKDRLKTCLRSGDTVSYWEENKFSLLMPQINGVEEVVKISQRIIKSVEKPFQIENRLLTTNINLGITIYPQDGDSADILIENANSALHHNRWKKNESLVFYNPNVNSQTSVTLKLEYLLSQALHKQELLIQYQPQVDTITGNVQSIEALLRWKHPELGLLLPNSFIKIAENSKLILPIGEWVLKNVCNQSIIWQQHGLPPIQVYVNISSVEFKNPHFIELIQHIIHQTKLDPSLLELDIAASTLMEDFQYSCHTLLKLKNLGVKISMDDFGSSSSSLQKIKKMPINTVKIAQNFVKEMKNDSKDLAIVASIVALGRGLNSKVVAEGVETLEQMKLLQSQECEAMQGFWFSRPLALEETTKILPFNYKK